VARSASFAAVVAETLLEQGERLPRAGAGAPRESREVVVAAEDLTADVVDEDAMNADQGGRGDGGTRIVGAGPGFLGNVIVVHGSPRLAQTLIEHDLVDALHLQVYPVIVGAGKRLFSETSGTKRLRLTEARTVGDGIHILLYEKAT
jgi:dihydrofolate reductase